MNHLLFLNKKILFFVSFRSWKPRKLFLILPFSARRIAEFTKNNIKEKRVTLKSKMLTTTLCPGFNVNFKAS